MTNQNFSRSRLYSSELSLTLFRCFNRSQFSISYKLRKYNAICANTMGTLHVQCASGVSYHSVTHLLQEKAPKNWWVFWPSHYEKKGNIGCSRNKWKWEAQEICCHFSFTNILLKNEININKNGEISSARSIKLHAFAKLKCQQRMRAWAEEMGVLL